MPVAVRPVEYRATGRRKEAVARVRLLPGTGKIVINGRPFEQYFPVLSWRAEVLKPLQLTATLDKYDVIATVDGGGMAGQAGAVRHGIARALLLVDPHFRRTLKRMGLLTRDPRVKERRKYGLKKARKAPQWSKR